MIKYEYVKNDKINVEIPFLNPYHVPKCLLAWLQNSPIKIVFLPFVQFLKVEGQLNLFRLPDLDGELQELCHLDLFQHSSHHHCYKKII